MGEPIMFGVLELIIVLGIGLLGLAVLVGLFFVIRFAVRSNNHDTIEPK